MLHMESIDSIQEQKIAIMEFDIEFLSPCPIDVITLLSPATQSIYYSIGEDGPIIKTPEYSQKFMSYGCPTQYGFALSFDGEEQALTPTWVEQFAFDQLSGSIAIDVTNNLLQVAGETVTVRLFKESLESLLEPGRTASYEFDIIFLPCSHDIVYKESPEIQGMEYTIANTGSISQTP